MTTKVKDKRYKADITVSSISLTSKKDPKTGADVQTKYRDPVTNIEKTLVTFKNNRGRIVEVSKDQLDVQEAIESSRSFKQGHIVIVPSAEELAEAAKLKQQEENIAKYKGVKDVLSLNDSTPDASIEKLAEDIGVEVVKDGKKLTKLTIIKKIKEKLEI
jgi:hypothetical protein